MKIQILTHSKLPGHTYMLITLKKGEHYKSKGSISQNAGHVITLETPRNSHWAEFDLDDPRFYATAQRLQRKGWKKQNSPSA